jgi:hypothetical protein
MVDRGANSRRKSNASLNEYAGCNLSCNSDKTLLRSRSSAPHLIYLVPAAPNHAHGLREFDGVGAEAISSIYARQLGPCAKLLPGQHDAAPYSYRMASHFDSFPLELDGTNTSNILSEHDQKKRDSSPRWFGRHQLRIRLL